MAKTETHHIYDIGREVRDDSSNRMRVQSALMPSVVVSEEKQAKDASAALRTLRQRGSMDLVEMLGLNSYLEGAN